MDIDEVRGTEEEKQVTPKFEEMDPELLDWLKIDDKKPTATTDVNEDSVTEADSDNVDVAEPDEAEMDSDDWIQVKGEVAGSKYEQASGKQFEKVKWILHLWDIPTMSCRSRRIRWAKRTMRCNMTKN